MLRFLLLLLLLLLPGILAPQSGIKPTVPASEGKTLNSGPLGKMKVMSLSRVWLFATPWNVSYQSPLSMGFSRQKYWSGLPLPSQRIFPTQGLNSGLPHYEQTLYHLSHQARTPDLQGSSAQFLDHIPLSQLFIILVKLQNYLWRFFHMVTSALCFSSILTHHFYSLYFIFSAFFYNLK